MRLMQSLWTGTPRFRLRLDHILVQTLSISLATKHHGEIAFATDRPGQLLAQEMGWGVRIERTLDDMDRVGLRHVWALGKLTALARSTEPVIQFDGDVLLMEPLPEWFLSAPIVAQSVDYPGGYIHPPMKEARRICGFPEDWTPYNCGLCGGAGHAEVQRYACEALEKARLFRNMNTPALPGTSVSMILEQWSLHQFNPVVLDKGHPYYSDFTGRPYAHLAGERKSNPGVVADVIETLEAQVPEALELAQNGFNRIKTTPNHPLTRFLRVDS